MSSAVANVRARAIPAIAALCLVFLAAPSRSWGLVFSASQDPTYNTAAPTGEYAGSGWRAMGKWSAGSGTAISPYHVLTAKHFKPGDGTQFQFRGESYEVLDRIDDPSTDLRILELAEPLGTWVNLYTGTDESGAETVVFGRGRAADDPVSEGGELKGWEWADYDGVLRWGTNTIEGFASSDQGTLIHMQFNNGASQNETGFADWDSGGGQFIQDVDGEWKLAGVVFAADGTYDVDADHDNGNEFNAVLFDERGFYEKTSPTSWTFRIDRGIDRPQSMYTTRVSERVSWIDSIISGSDPLDGDTDFDGDVDFDDAWNLLNAYKVDGDWSWFDGDFTHDGIVDETDADILLANYGTGVSGGLDSAGLEAMLNVHSVPEPTTLLLLAAGAGVLVRRRR
jgi:hypothetical protein